METRRSEEVTVLLRRWDEQGDKEALDEALPHLIHRMRELARGYLSREPPGHTLEPTALVSEAYLRLLESRIGKIERRAQFFAFTARLMRQILVDHARTRRAVKRGGELERAKLDDALEIAGPRGFDIDQILTVHEILDKLQVIDPRQREIVEMRYFVGLSVREVAQALEVSIPTVERQWRAARLWLGREVRHQTSHVAP